MTETRERRRLLFRPRIIGKGRLQAHKLFEEEVAKSVRNEIVALKEQIENLTRFLERRGLKSN